MTSTDNNKVVKHRIVWRLENFKRETFAKSISIKVLKSRKFTIFLRGNKTEW